MKNYPKHRGNAPKDIYKEDYDEILKAAKRKHSDEFFIFLTLGWYSESCVDVFDDCLEHWKKVNGRWQKQ